MIRDSTVSVRLFGCVRWYVRPPSPGIEQLPPAEAYDEL